MFKDLRNKKSATILYENLMKELSKHLSFIKLKTDFVLDTVQFDRNNTITFTHVYKGNEILSRQTFNQIDGIEIFSEIEKVYKPILVFANGDSISHITLNFKSVITRELDINKLRYNDLIVTKIKTVNPDMIFISNLLKKLGSSNLNLLNLEETFEVQVDNKNYYTVFDMEDGNYIAINKKQEVFRLIHDHSIVAKKVFNNVEEFCKVYKGKKENLDY
jgi:hypothetical protein